MKNFCFSLLLLIGLIFSPLDSFAQPTPPATPASTYNFDVKVNACLTTSPDPTIPVAAWKEKYTARLVFCMRDLLLDSTKFFLAHMINTYAMTMVSAIVIFAMMIFGIKVLGGTLRNPKAETATLLLKLGFIWFILALCNDAANSPIVDFWFDTTDLMIEMISGASSTAFGSTSFCPTSNNISGWFSIWDRFDCLFEKFLGYGSKIASGGGMIALIGAIIFTSGFGLWIAMMAIGAIVGLALFLFRSCFLVLLSYGGLGLLLLMLPLCLPLILFKPTEKFLWDCWLRYATGYVLQPALTVGFLLFAITILDGVMMNGSTTKLGETTYVTYDAIRNESVVSVIKAGEPIPAGAQKAILTPAEILGFSYSDSVDKQNEKIRGLYRTDKNSDMPKLEGDATSYSYQSQDCGKAGVVNHSKEVVDGAENICTDPAKCKDALKKAFDAMKNNQDPSAYRNKFLAFQKAACEFQKADRSSLDRSGTDLENNSLDLGGGSSTRLELNRPNTSDQLVPAGTLPSQDNQHDHRLMQLLGYVGSVLVLCGTFFKFIAHVPGLVKGICGAPGQSLGFSSPVIGGKSLTQRFEKGLQNAEQNWRRTLKQHKDAKSGKGDAKKQSFAQRAGLGVIESFGKGVWNGRTDNE